MTHSLSVFDEKGAGPDLVEAPELHLIVRADAPLEISVRLALHGVSRVDLGRGSGPGVTHRLDQGTLDVRLPDGKMSSLHARLDVIGDRVRVQDCGSKNGTYVNGVRVEAAQLGDGDVIEVGHAFFLFRGVGPSWADAEPRPRLFGVPELTTFSPKQAEAYAAAMDLARSELGVFIVGETGTGKEVLARAVHRLSACKGAFVVLDGAALPPGVSDRHLFGAVEDLEPSGLIRATDDGTLFLDEVTELPLTWQAALLRVLQERSVTPVGGTRPVPVRFRPVAATHENLDEALRGGRLRRDFRARIGGAEVELSPLRERKVDLGLLLQAAIRRASSNPEAVCLRRRAVRALLRYDWPANIRELDGAVRYALARAGDAPVALEHLPSALHDSAPSISEGKPPPPAPAPVVRPEPIEAAPVPPLAIDLLGVLEVRRPDGAVDLPPSKKVRALLAYLAATRRAHRRERLCAMFCEFADDPRAALRWQLSRLRPVLNDETHARLVADREQVSLDLTDTSVDYLAVADVVNAGLDGRSLDDLESLARRFRGGFLEGLSLPDCAEFEVWRIALEEESLVFRVKVLRALLGFGDQAAVRVLPHARALRALVPDDARVGISVQRIELAARRDGLAGN